MRSLSKRREELGFGLMVLAGYAVVAGLLSIVLSIPAMLDGEGFGYSRAAIGLVGILAGVLTLTGRRVGLGGWSVLRLWALLQIPFISDEQGGNYFRQLIEGLLGATSSSSVNGEIVTYSQLGVNIVGLVLLIIVYRLREPWEFSERNRREALSQARVEDENRS